METPTNLDKWRYSAISVAIIAIVEMLMPGAPLCVKYAALLVLYRVVMDLPI